MSGLNLITRLANLFRGFLSLFVSGIEKDNPEIVYENAINGMISKHAQLKNATAGLVRLREQTSVKLQSSLKEQMEIKGMLDAAVDKGDEELGPVLIERLDAINAQIADLEATLEGYAKDAEGAKSALLEVQAEVQKLRAEKERNLARIASAKAKQAINDQLDGLSVDADLRALENVRTSVENEVAKAKLGDELRGSDLDQRLKELRKSSNQTNAKAKFAALKQQREAAGQGDGNRSL